MKFWPSLFGNQSTAKQKEHSSLDVTHSTGGQDSNTGSTAGEAGILTKSGESPETKWPDAKKKFMDTLQYVIKSEETRLTDGSFSKIYNDEADWSSNHFLINSGGMRSKRSKDNKQEEHRVITTSYDLDLLRKKLDPRSSSRHPFSVNDGTPSKSKPHDDSKQPLYWLRFDRQLEASPSVIPEGESELRQYLEYVQQKNPGKFKELHLSEIPARLTIDDLPKEEGGEQVHHFLANELSCSVARSVAPIYKTLFELKRKIDQGDMELILGFLHVRKRYPTGKEQEEKIINGPLLEMSLDAVLEDGGAITLTPKSNTRVKVNSSVLSALRTGGGGAEANPETVKSLLQLVEKTDAKSLFPGKPDVLSKLLEIAEKMRYNMWLKPVHAKDVHDILAVSAVLPSNSGHFVPYRANGKRLVGGSWLVNNDMKRQQLLMQCSSSFEATGELQGGVGALFVLINAKNNQVTTKTALLNLAEQSLD